MSNYEFVTHNDDKLYSVAQQTNDALKLPFHSRTRREQLQHQLTHATFEILCRWQEIKDLDDRLSGGTHERE